MMVDACVMDIICADEFSKINRRAGHVGVCYNNQLYVWGGYTQIPPAEQLDPFGLLTRSEYYEPEKVWIYDCLRERWYLRLACGKHGDDSIPPENSGSCSVLVNSDVYVFGGYSFDHQNLLYRLDLKTLTWEKLSPSGVQPLECDKLSGWTYKDKVYFFGGFGARRTSSFPSKFQWVEDEGSSYRSIGWNNQLVCYDPARNCWEWPETTGRAPCPRAAHSGTRHGKFAYIFGGRHQNLRMNDLHILDLENMSWSGEISKLDNEPWPDGRSWHSLTFIADNLAVLYGGFTQYNQVLNDCWLLDVRGRPRWFPCEGKRRSTLLWHVGLSSNGELYIVGGIQKDPNEALLEHPDEMLVINFSPKSLYRLCLDAVVKYDKLVLRHDVFLPTTISSVLNEKIRWRNMKQVQFTDSMPHARKIHDAVS